MVLSFKFRIETKLTGSRLLSDENMTDEAKLLKCFESKGVIYGDELIVLKKFCTEFMQASKLAGFAVIGIEGFYLFKDGSVKPNIEEVADFSDIESVFFNEYIEKCYEASDNFIKYMLLNGKSDGYCFVLTDSLY